MASLAARIALVTGGASGLGLATVKRLAGLGARVMIADIDPAAEEIAKSLGDNVMFHKTDVTSAEDVTAALDLMEANWGILDTAVNCAGIAVAIKTVGKKGAHDLDLFRKVLDVNTTGPFNVCRLAAERMQTADADDEGLRGLLVNTASIAAYEGQIGQVAYAASKGGILGMILPMARDLSKLGIRVCGIAPGVFDTPMVAGLPAKVKEETAQKNLSPKRLGNPDEYAKLVQFMMETSFMNGEVVRIDGGYRMEA